jgi:outer membrane biosynthesis protein TonB
MLLDSEALYNGKAHLADPRISGQRSSANPKAKPHVLPQSRLNWLQHRDFPLHPPGKSAVRHALMVGIAASVTLAKEKKRKEKKRKEKKRKEKKRKEKKRKEKKRKEKKRKEKKRRRKILELYWRVGEDRQSCQ